MVAYENADPLASIHVGHHHEPAMPEGDDNVFASLPPGPDVVIVDVLNPHGSPQETYHLTGQEWHSAHHYLVGKSAHTVSRGNPTPPPLAPYLLIFSGKLHGVKPGILTATPQEFIMNSCFLNRTFGKYYYPVGASDS